MRVLVTGAGGYIGQHVLRELDKYNVDILGTDIKDFDAASKVEKFIGDIFTDDFKNKLKVDVLIHLVWQDNFNHKSINHLKNISKHYEFISSIIENGCKNINAMGTMHEVGYYEGAITESTPCNPLSLYGIAKNSVRQSLLMLNNENIHVKWLRAFYITGDDERNNSIFAKILQMEREGQKTFPFNSGKNKYDFIDVNELALMIVKASLQTEVTGIINCCSGKPVPLKEKVESFIKENNLKIVPQYGAFPDRPYDSPAIWGDNKKILEILRK